MVIVGAALSAFLLLCVVPPVGLVIISQPSTEPAQPDDRALVITIDDLTRDVPGYAPDRRRELIERLRDGPERGLRYEYQDPPYSILAEVRFSTSAPIAERIYQGHEMVRGSIRGPLLDEARVERAGFAWGDQSRSQLVTQGGQPVGHAFIGRHGTRVVDFTFLGRPLETEREVGALLSPILARIEAHRP